MIALLLLAVVVGACYFTRYLLTSGAGSPVRTITAESRQMLLPSKGSGLECTRWTALDDHQLNRLLDEFSP
jgi:hypothetical protein